MHDEQRRLAAIMFTDMVGYSSLTQKNEKIAMELLEEHRRILRPIFAEHEGKEIKTIGDAFLVCFDNTLNAVNCAIKIQDALFEYNRASPETIQIKIRIGIHLGDVIMRGGDLYGDGVNIAARVQSSADSGGISISEDVFRQVQNKIEATFTKLGKGDLKNISSDMSIYKVSPKTTQGLDLLIQQIKFLWYQKRTRTLAFGLAAIMLVFITVLTINSSSTPKSAKQELEAKIERIRVRSEKERPKLNILVADFMNETSDKRLSRLDNRITKLFIATLEQSDTFKVMPREQMRLALKQMKREKERWISPSVAKAICKQTNTPVFVSGSVKKFGKTFTLDVKAYDVLEDKTLITVVGDAQIIDSIPSTLGRLVSAIRSELELQALQLHLKREEALATIDTIQSNSSAN